MNDALFSDVTRRTILKTGLWLGSGLALAGAAGVLKGCNTSAGKQGASTPAASQEFAGVPRRIFKISLAQWSYHRALYEKRLDPFDFPRTAIKDHQIDAVEYVNTFYKDHADAASIRGLRDRCHDLGVTSVLIMCDGEGNLGDPDNAKRLQAVENHRRWLEAAKILGCHSIRVNAHSEGSYDEQQRLAADGLRRLCEVGDTYDLNVIVENHGGLSSNGKWLTGVMRMVGHKRVGTLPDFGNFKVSDSEEYDRYLGTAEMMPWAKGVSAKCYDFDEATGEETRIDYRRMVGVVLDAGYRGRLGIEYEGERLPEPEGVRRCKTLLERLHLELAAGGKYNA